MFTAIGIFVLLYVGHALSRGEVHAKSGLRWRMVSRQESPGYFSVVIAIYAILGIALIFAF